MKATARAAPLEDGIWGVNRNTAYGLLSSYFKAPEILKKKPCRSIPTRTSPSYFKAPEILKKKPRRSIPTRTSPRYFKAGRRCWGN